MDFFPEITPVPRKKADTEALASPFMRIPKLRADEARDLIDLGFTQIYQLAGRSPETLFDDIRKKRPATPGDRLNAFRFAIAYAENPDRVQR